ncbi:hypothetical protein Tco_1062550 [Tanacetum coccineum]
MERSPIVVWLSAYAMHQARSKELTSPIWTRCLKRCVKTPNSLSKIRKRALSGKEGIVLGHKISKNGIEVDKAKVDVIAMLPSHM